MTLIGVDLGRVKDYCTINIFEDRLVERPTTRQPYTRRITPMEAPTMLTRIYDLIELGEMVGVSYPDIAARINKICMNPRVSKPYALVLDATGVGIAVCDMLRAPPYNLFPYGITSTSGAQPSDSPWGKNVPKLDLVTNMLLLFETERIKIAADLAHLDDYRDQLKDFSTIPSRGGGKFSNEHEGVHDDFVMGSAVVLWYAENMLQPYIELPTGGTRPTYNPATHGLTGR